MVTDGIGHNQQPAILSGAELSDNIFWQNIACYNILLFCEIRFKLEYSYSLQYYFCIQLLRNGMHRQRVFRRILAVFIPVQTDNSFSAYKHRKQTNCSRPAELSSSQKTNLSCQFVLADNSPHETPFFLKQFMCTPLKSNMHAWQISTCCSCTA